MTLNDLLIETARDGRVCPQPKQWNRLWGMLPERHQQDTGWQPPLSLILAAWWEATDEQKRERFHEHLRWAEQHGALNEIATYLHSLTLEDWYTGN